MNRYAQQPTIFTAKFPSSKAALNTIGFTLKNTDGTEYAARSTTDVINRGNGSFSVTLTLPALSGTILWDSGEVTPVPLPEEEFLIETPPGSSSGTGAIATTIIVKVNDIPLDNVAIYATTDIYGNNVVAGTSFSDSFGKVTFMLDAGDYYVWKQRAGINFTNPELITVV